jgi:hypothetical protein
MPARICLLLSLILAGVVLGAPVAFASREQVEQLLAHDVPSGSSAASVTKFLDAHGIGHGRAEAAGPVVQLSGTVANLRRGAEHYALQIRFSFLQDRLIGYSFTEVPGARLP